MASIGTMVNDAKQGQNYSAPFMMLAMAPFFFFVVILFDPNGTLSVLLSLFPFTSPMTLMLRYGMTSIPLWQIGLAIVLLVLSIIAAMWLAGRIFRIGMLRFDKGVQRAEAVAEDVVVVQAPGITGDAPVRVARHRRVGLAVGQVADPQRDDALHTGQQVGRVGGHGGAVVVEPGKAVV